MNTARYVVAVWCLVVYPPILLFWMLVHSFVTFWRKVGLAATYAMLSLLLVGFGILLFQLRTTLIGGDLGTSWPAIIVGGIVLGVSLVIETRCRRALSLSTLAGVPEIGPTRPGQLLTSGVYSRVRHPRYVAAMLGFLGVVLFANHVSTYILFLAFVPGIYLVVTLEERELVDRFGEHYRRYQDAVPRFVPLRRSNVQGR